MIALSILGVIYVAGIIVTIMVNGLEYSTLRSLANEYERDYASGYYRDTAGQYRVQQRVHARRIFQSPMWPLWALRYVVDMYVDSKSEVK